MLELYIYTFQLLVIVFMCQAIRERINRPSIGKQTIVELSNIVTIASATIVIVENVLSLSPNNKRCFYNVILLFMFIG